MTVTVARSPSGRILVVSLIGEHDMATTDAVRHAVQSDEVLSSQTKVVVLDLAECTFLDSSIIAVLMAGYRHASARGLTFIAVNATNIVATVLHLTGVDRPLQLNLAADLRDREVMAALQRPA